MARSGLPLLDAGGANEGPEVSTPARALDLIASPSAWQTPTVAQDAAGGRVVPLAIGRGLGGGTSINEMWWFQGHPSDYDGWAAAGATGWGWDEVLPVLRSIEDHELGAPVSTTAPEVRWPSPPSGTPTRCRRPSWRQAWLTARP